MSETPELADMPGQGRPLRLMCRQTRQPVTMVIGRDKCPHCGATSHGLDLTYLNKELAKLGKPKRWLESKT